MENKTFQILRSCFSICQPFSLNIVMLYGREQVFFLMFQKLNGGKKMTRKTIQAQDDLQILCCSKVTVLEMAHIK